MEIIMTDKKKTKKKSSSERDIVEEVSKIADKMRMSFDEVGKNRRIERQRISCLQRHIQSLYERNKRFH